jgi:DNA-directed RNA polymerase specialized sigma24 family protein
VLFNRPEGYTELELLEEVAGGNESAFNLLYEKYAGKVYAMGIKYLKSPFMAQDAVQEIFVKVWNNRGQLPWRKTFHPFFDELFQFPEINVIPGNCS